MAEVEESDVQEKSEESNGQCPKSDGRSQRVRSPREEWEVQWPMSEGRWPRSKSPKSRRRAKRPTSDVRSRRRKSEDDALDWASDRRNERAWIGGDHFTSRDTPSMNPTGS